MITSHYYEVLTVALTLLPIFLELSLMSDSFFFVSPFQVGVVVVDEALLVDGKGLGCSLSPDEDDFVTHCT